MNNFVRQGWIPVWFLTAGHFLSDFYQNFLPAILPLVMPKLALSLTTSGLLVMTFSFTSSILQPVIGYYIDKKGCTWLLLVTLPVSAIFICSAALSVAVWQLFFCITLAGLAAAIFHPLAAALLGKISPPESRGASMSVFIGGGNIGVAAAPASFIFFVLTFGTANLPWLAVPGILLTVLFYLRGTHRISLISAEKSGAVVKSPAPPWYKSLNLLKLNLVMGLRSWPQVAIPNFLIIWLTQQGHSPALSGSLLTTFLLGGAVGSVAGGYACDKLGRKKSVIGILLLAVPLIYFFFTAAQIDFFTYLLLGLSGALLQGVLPASMVWAQEMLPANAAMASGMMLGLSFGLGGLGAAVTGALADAIGLQQALLWTMAPLLAAALITTMIPEKEAVLAEKHF
ncbi:MAG: MFS transporter [Sporomusaceae bacterium]|jgi:FSR family fosmidomycin resistance protein-like MFS transporter|nr:MFS transporter [Sporomusaceae bacterium]